tara:strand:- start:40 stop:168 length:129 start_codon:yes stop_codon:yes gene_type:complete
MLFRLKPAPLRRLAIPPSTRTMAELKKERVKLAKQDWKEANG